MNVWFLIIGTACLGFGLFTVIDDKHNERMQGIWRRNETALDKKIFPGRQGEFISRYLAGGTFIAIGALFILFAYIDSFH
jgi:hypothetical protein